MTGQIPTRLYKYRSFDSLSLRLLCESESWYSCPSAFNDPLESLPEPIDDIDQIELMALHDYFCEGRGGGIRDGYRYGYDEEGGEFEVEFEQWRRMIVRDIANRLVKTVDSCGILTLSQRWNSPLMWSHYADSHRGFCIEYDATDHRCKYIDRVSYDSNRGLRLSDIYAWKIKQSKDGLARFVDSTYFRKAKDWSYEEEWRDISSHAGVHFAPFEVSAIIFGMRCPSQVRTAIMLTYQGTGASKKPEFYEASFKSMSFEMQRASLDPHEVAYIRPSASMAFGSHQTVRELPFSVDG